MNNGLSDRDIQALAVHPTNGRVIYAGTTSKTLAPGLRLGWLAVPHRLSERIARAKVAADYGSGALDQLTLAALGADDADLAGRVLLDVLAVGVRAASNERPEAAAAPRQVMAALRALLFDRRKGLDLVLAVRAAHEPLG